jgi:hypothetical protein
MGRGNLSGGVMHEESSGVGNSNGSVESFQSVAAEI